MESTMNTIRSAVNISVNKAESIRSDISKKTLNETISLLQNASVLTASFYLSTNIMQRIAGKLRIHSGKHLLLASSFGILSVAVSSVISTQINESFPEIMTKPENILSINYSWNHLKNILLDEKIPLTVFFYHLVERKYFLTTVPSSVISIGVHANHGTFSGGMFPGSVISTDATATEKQRTRIQKLGKMYGCHHCGSRQRINFKANFIADHMPPTKVALQKNSVWWRRILNFKVIQRLYPQCQSCFQQQGSAVKTNNHLLIYHNIFKFYHFTPAIIYFLLRDEDFKHYFESFSFKKKFKNMMSFFNM